MYIDPSDYQMLRSYLNKNEEVGGYFDLAGGGRMIPHISTNGGHNSISMDGSHPYLFHTHPGRCDNIANCSFGMPSSQDMKQIYNAALEGNIAHFVIAHEGMYVIQANCSILGRGAGDAIQEKFKQFQNSLQTDYDRFMIEWIEFANQTGFRVLYYPPSASLQFQLRAACS